MNIYGCSSLAWLDDEGERVLREQATFRLWKVRHKDGRVAGFVAVPVDDPGDLKLIAASRALKDPSVHEAVSPARPRVTSGSNVRG